MFCQHRRSENGFTLVELLVVLVVLGVLAGVVVMAASGLGSQTATTASAADLKTLTEAEEAHLATSAAGGKYATEDALVLKFLAAQSTMHDICLSPNKKAYRIVVQVPPPGDSCAGVSVPNP